LQVIPPEDFSARNMSTLRLCLFAAILAVGIQMAAGQGSVQTCPSVSNAVYSYTNITSQANCTTTLCTCLGGTRSGSQCTFKSYPNCSTITTCTTQFITCSNNLTDNTLLYMSVVSINAGSLYNQSLAYAACQNYACNVWNFSNTNASCAIAYSSVCVSPAIFIGTLVISGNWTAIVANATALAITQAALAKDLSAVLGFPATIISAVAGSLIVTFSVPCSGNNAALQAGLAAAKAGTSWLANTQSAFTSLGGVGTLTVLGIGAQGSGVPGAPGGPTIAPAGGPTPPASTPAPSAAATATIAQLLVAAAALMLLA
jgi:hypothetical protein